MKTRVTLAAITLVVALWAVSNPARAEDPPPQAHEDPPRQEYEGPPPQKCPVPAEKPSQKIDYMDWRGQLKEVFPNAAGQSSQGTGSEAYELGKIVGYIVGALILLRVLGWIAKLGNGTSNQ